MVRRDDVCHIDHFQREKVVLPNISVLDHRDHQVTCERDNPGALVVFVHHVQLVELLLLRDPIVQNDTRIHHHVNARDCEDRSRYLYGSSR